MPRISVIMPSYNQASFLEEAVRSVLDQTAVDQELLVFDPGSVDGSRELLLRLKDHYGERLRLFFEPDSGQPDAINKGMALATGEILCWLNSDDRLRQGALAKVAERFADAGPAWLYGRSGMIDDHGCNTSSLIVRYKNWRGASFSRFKLLTENFIPQMSVFWNRAIWIQSGGLDCSKHLDMDYDLWLKFAAIVDPFIIKIELSDFRVHGNAKGSTQTGAQLDAAFRTARTHGTGRGLKAQVALWVHKLLGIRTRLVYLVLKP